MTSTRTILASSVAALGMLAPTWAAAQSNDSTVSETQGEQHGSVVQVDESVEFAISRRCRYSTRVTGSLTEETITEGRFWAPDLRAVTTLTCPHAVATVTYDHVGLGKSFAPDQIGPLLERYASFRRSDGWRSCVYVANLRFDGRSLDAGPVRFVCRPTLPVGIGGGPRL